VEVCGKPNDTKPLRTPGSSSNLFDLWGEPRARLASLSGWERWKGLRAGTIHPHGELSSKNDSVAPLELLTAPSAWFSTLARASNHTPYRAFLDEILREKPNRIGAIAGVVGACSLVTKAGVPNPTVFAPSSSTSNPTPWWEQKNSS
jgi:hypothetical protein